MVFYWQEPVKSEEPHVVKEEPLPKSEPPTRLTGEKFLKLGGSFVQPVKKLPHQVSTVLIFFVIKC